MPPSQPKSPNPDFDFMLKNQPQARRPLLPGVSRPVKIGLAAVIGIILLIIIFSWLGGRKNSSFQPIVGAAARSHEVLRETTFVQQKLQLQNPDTVALAATVSAAMSSEQQQLLQYLSNNHVKVGTAQLAADADTSTDASLQTASQNNTLDSAYINYLKQGLASYQTDLQTAYKSAGPKGKTILNDAYNSTQTLLASPQFN